MSVLAWIALLTVTAAIVVVAGVAGAVRIYLQLALDGEADSSTSSAPRQRL